MVPGKSFDGLLEARIDPNKKFNASAQVYYENYDKSYNHEFLLTGIEGTWMALSRFGSARVSSTRWMTHIIPGYHGFF